MNYAIIGLGGTGGYLGGLLVRAGEEVCFIARGETLAAIEEKGLDVRSEIMGDFIAHPAFVSDSPQGIARDRGCFDVVFVCVKGYSLDEAVLSVKPLVGDETMVIPLLNGVGHGARISQLLYTGLVLDACMYVTSKSPKPGAVVHTDKYNKIVMGADSKRPASAAQQNKIQAVAAAIRRAGMDCVVSEDIEGATWEKFNYNCAFSVLTALYQTDAAGIRANPEWLGMMRALSEETAAVAKALGIRQPADITDRSMKILEVMLPEGTSSMKRDVEAGRDSELELFSGTLCLLAESCGVAVPVSRRIYEALK